MREVAGFILVNSEGKILLQHRTDDAPTDASKWSIFGGGVEEGESPLEAVKRECVEELDYELKNPKLIYEKQIDGELVYVYLETYNSQEKLNLKEGQGMDWFSPEELEKLDLANHSREILEDIITENF